jgi:hypothetical protein
LARAHVLLHAFKQNSSQLSFQEEPKSMTLIVSVKEHRIEVATKQNPTSFALGLREIISQEL